MTESVTSLYNKVNMVKKLISIKEGIWNKVKADAALNGKKVYEWIEEAFVTKLNGKS